VATVCGVLSAIALAGIGVVAEKHFGHSADKALKLQMAPTPTPTPTRTRTRTRAVIAAPKSWKLTFDSAFSGSQLDSSVWGTCYPWAAGGCTNYGNTNDQDREWYQASQDQVSGGILHLVAQREPTLGVSQNGAPKEYACRSGIVTTYPSLRFEYGYVQITAKIPFDKGLWPAFWLAAANLRWPPEIDILEHWWTAPYGKVYLHPTAGPRQGGAVNLPDLAAGWHTFSIEWTKSRLTWYYDGSQILTTTTGVPQQAMYLIANLADDNTSPGTCSGSLLIKSVKVWQPPS
jgi:beta-glucanase (GH16 family)